MADQFNNPNNISGPTTGQVPPPPSSGSVDIRTQFSDINSIKQSGGASPSPEQFNLGDNSQIPQIPQAPANISNSMAPQGNNEPVFDPNQAKNTSSRKIDVKKLSIIGVVIIILIILGWVGYSYVYKMFFPSAIPSVIVDNNEVVEEAPIIEEVVAPEESIVYKSFIDFTASPGSYGATLPTLSNDLVNLAGLSVFTQANNFSELIINNNNAQRASFAEFLGVALGLNQVEADNLFENSLTSFLYLDETNNLSVGYVGKIKDSASLALARDFIKNIESSNSLINIFTSNSLVADPGGFKDGQVNSLPGRYLPYSNEKSLSYFWSGNHIVITTSYNSAKFVEPKLIN